MSNLFTPRNVLIGAGAVAAFAYAPGFFGNMMRTPGVQNIENRFTAGGGAPDGKPAIATPRGDPNNVSTRQKDPATPTSPRYQNEIADQKPDPGPVDRAWNKTQYNTEKANRS